MSAWTGRMDLGIGFVTAGYEPPERPEFPETLEPLGPGPLAAIEARARKNFALRTAGNLLDGLDDVVRAVQSDVPRLLSEVKRLRALVEPEETP